MSGGINCGTTCSVQFNNTATVTLTAVAAQGSTFAGWSAPTGTVSSNGCTGTVTPCSITMSNVEVTLTATFDTAATCSAPAISGAQPSDKSITYGADATFTAAATGSPTPAMRWQISTNGGSTWADVPGATSSPLTLTKP